MPVTLQSVLERVRENDPEFTEIELSGPEIDVAAIQNLTNALKNNTHVYKIVIQEHAIPKGSMRCIYPLIRSNGNITAFLCPPIRDAIIDQSLYHQNIRQLIQENKDRQPIKKDLGAVKNNGSEAGPY